MSLMDKLKKNSTIKETDVLSSSEFFNGKEMTPTDVPMVNVALSGDGFLRFANTNTLTTSDCSFRDHRANASSNASDDNEGMLVTFWEIP